ncbi:hypothetical protein UA08_06145 [Talaromyces atroroseus]|uniref:NIF system FeS cluster assembly NifU N-terminal domain-containing protein n=1 Tax=Talaromyces atroroseus TaxID=1441469 RepID=A0A225ASS5_TALAT|nr:hypothetical protein UA08_06145 [Talaromyces atroroseus]OKL58649.1 hypothetical protein UA08_06145 [Talaromyces atroroseus]
MSMLIYSTDELLDADLVRVLDIDYMRDEVDVEQGNRAEVKARYQSIITQIPGMSALWIANVGSGLVGAPACGDVIRLDIQVDEKTGKIVKSAFKTFGCGSAIASSSYLTTLLAGKTLEEAGKIQNTQIANELCLPPVKLHCSLLAEDAIKAAIKNYESKRPAAAATNLADTTKAFKETAAAA